MEPPASLRPHEHRAGCGPRNFMILQPPMELGRPAGARKDPREAQAPARTLDACNSLQKHFLSEENMVSHFSHLSLDSDHSYCPSAAFSMGTPAPPVIRPLEDCFHSTEDLGVLCPSLLLALNPHSELLLWQYPGNQIPEILRLLRLGGSQVYQNHNPHSGEAMEL
ncbi:host cell factor C1 regulator 1 isoform X2 [Antechinus flavipes]|uniref:host cell factor C1 regulator 1 isoform X2 n=1 Tax=Antechinus flavipes TaxID=38775 RepID=UPI002235D408|nr:host cell factor C1 regulator 1 isoform X2 [Antechinus flavipes]